MTSLLRSVLFRDNETTPISITDWAKMFRPGGQVTYQGNTYQGYQLGGGGPGSGHYEGNSIVFACASKRIAVFSEARFQWQRMRDGRPEGFFGTPELGVFEEPWPGATTRDLLTSVEMDVLCHGNSYWVRDEDGFLLRLDPARVKILTEAIADPVSGFTVGERLLGYGFVSERDRVAIFEPRAIAHYRPHPSSSQFVGQSWLSPCLPDIDADSQMTEHKRSQLRQGANLGAVVSLDPTLTVDQFNAFVDAFEEKHHGVNNAGRTLFLGGGADVKTVGQTFENLALKATQGATETRIAACAWTHPVVVGLSEGMQGSSLNAGNYGAAKRSFGDSGMRPLWGAFAAAFQWLVNVPAGSRLWYDSRDIAFLRDDEKDEAEIAFRYATTMRTLVDAGYTADSVQACIAAGFDVSLLQHSGLFSVQLQEPGVTQDDVPAAAGAVSAVA